jgi:hypothetical protein
MAWKTHLCNNFIDGITVRDSQEEFSLFAAAQCSRYIKLSRRYLIAQTSERLDDTAAPSYQQRTANKTTAAISLQALYHHKSGKPA